MSTETGSQTSSHTNEATIGDAVRTGTVTSRAEARRRQTRQHREELMLRIDACLEEYGTWCAALACGDGATPPSAEPDDTVRAEMNGADTGSDQHAMWPAAA